VNLRAEPPRAQGGRVHVVHVDEREPVWRRARPDVARDAASVDAAPGHGRQRRRLFTVDVLGRTSSEGDTVTRWDVLPRSGRATSQTSARGTRRADEDADAAELLADVLAAEGYRIAGGA
jgi:hypothetical protein